MKVRISPSGFEVEERPNGLYLLGNLTKAHGLIQDKEWRTSFTTLVPGCGYRVEIGYSDSIERDGVAEFGVGPTSQVPWRYALGAAIGSYDDPIKEEKTTGVTIREIID